MCRKLFVTKLTFLLPALYLFSTLSYSHGIEGESQNHAYDDMYLAEQARLRESKVSYLIDNWQEHFIDKLNQLNASLLSELVDSAFASDNPAVDGQWGSNTSWPFAFASAANLPDGRILAWGANLINSFNGGNKTYAGIWDPANDQIIRVDHSTHSMFCGMPVMLEDGRVFVAGGDVSSSSSVKRTSTFDFSTQTWTRVQDMHVGRWYNGSVALPNGKVFTAVGDPGSQYPELWTQSTGWDYLNGASLQSAILKYNAPTEPKNMLPHMHLAPNGKIFHSGHTPQMNYIDTAGIGSITPVSIVNDFNGANASGALYDEGKLLQAGGSLYENNTSTTHAAIIDINSATPERTHIAEMQYPRIFHNQVILPNGEVMVIGGNTTGEKFSDRNLITGVSTSILTPEIWSPFTQTWRTVAPHSTPRNYHSVALLMTDGRIWSGGGGLCACSADHPDSAVFTPPYLFNADGTLATRPEIINAPSIVSYGQTIDVSATHEVSRFTMVKMSSTTHAINSDMRFLNVQFTPAFDGHYSLTLHTNRNVMTPGYWMLFALNTQGVPSLAKVIKVSTSNSPVITVPADQSTIVGADVDFSIAAADPNGDALSYDAVGLPQGLTINSATGQISGIPGSIGSSRIVISVSDGTNTASAGFVWTIVNDQSPPVASSTFGNNSGSSFSDTVNPDELLTSINIHSSGVLDAIQGVLNTGDLPEHGGDSGTLTNVTWPIDEYLVRIYGVYGFSIGKITFVTNTGRVLGPYGTASFGNNFYTFDYTVPVSREIVGFKGSANSYVNSIGVMYRVRQLRNQPPVVTSIIDQKNKVGHATELAVIASDPDSDILVYSAVGLPPGLSIDANTGIISGTTTTVGNYDVIVKVQDAKGGVSAINFSWTVRDAIIKINPITTTPQTVDAAVNFTASVSNGVNPRYKWSFGDGTAETEYSTTADVSHIYNLPGLYVVKFTAIDDVGATNNNTFIQAIYLPHTAKSPAASSNILVDNGNRLWVVNQDNDTVSVFNADSYAKLGEVTVGKAPRTVAQAPNGMIWVTNKKDASVSIIDPTILTVTQTVALPYASQPFGVAFSPDDTAAYVVLEGAGKLLKLNPANGVQLASLDVGTNPRHLSVTADSSKVLVSRFITPPMPGEATDSIDTSTKGGEVMVVDAAAMTINKTVILQHSNLQDDIARGAGIPNYLAMPVISPDGLSAWVPSKQDNIKRGTLRNGNNLNFQNTVRSIASKINLNTLAEIYSERADFDNSGIGSAAVFDRTGNYLFVALENTREVVLVDAYAGNVLDRINVGRAPDGLAISADGKKLFVSNFMDRTVSVVDIGGTLSWGEWQPPVVAQFNTVNQEKLSANVLVGKQYFYDAKDLRLARDGYLSCAVCHNDGGHDGRVWDLTGFGEGLRNTIDLRGRSGTGHGILHWSGNFDEIQDFEGQIRNLAGGTGLMSDIDFAATSDTLGTPKAGKSADLDELTAYVASLSSFVSSPQRNADGTLTADAAAGKVIFATAGCGQCHSGEPFTDSPTGLPHNDIGTIKPSSGKRLNGSLTALDTPTLRDVWNTAPYLHDGSAATLDLAIRAHTSVTLTDAEISKVAAYVQQIGGSEPAPDTTAPTVAITAPTDGSTVSGAGITVTADASDSDGLAGVQFKLDGVNLDAEDTTSGYGIAWDSTGVANGTHTLTAVARDVAGNITTSGPVTVTVHNDTTAPTVAITAPTDGSTVSGAGITVTADASDSDGLAGVQFKLDGVNLDAEDTTSGYGIAWDSTGVANGTHTLTAVARDVAGNITTSGPVTVTVHNDTTAPTVAITAPTDGSTVSGAGITVTADASDSDGLAGVQFKLDGVNLDAEDTTSGYGIAWDSTGVANGTHTLTAVARDVAGNITTSGPVTVTVHNDTTAPTVAITAPTDGSTVSGAGITVTADASDSDGLAGVQFKLDGVNLGAEDTTSGYGIAWDSTGVANGTYTLTAVARDTAGNIATSSAVTVTVNNNTQVLLPDVVVTALTYSNGVFTSTIKNQGTVATPEGVVIGVGYLVDGEEQTWGATETSLAAGASVTVSTDGDLYIIPNGIHTVTADVDDVNRFAELNETNNALTQTITIGGSDTTSPTVSISAPASSSTVTGSAVMVTATADDNLAVAGVQFNLDGVNLGAEDTSSPYSVTWDSTTATNTSHTLTAIARDTSGNTTTSSVVTVTVNNGGATPLPDVVVTDLAYSNGVFTSTIKNQGTAATPAGVAIGVGYSVDGVYKTWGARATSLAAGASATISTNGSTYTIPSGTHTITAKVDDVNRFAELEEANNSLSQSLTINGTGDTSAPTVLVNSPANNATVTGSAVNIAATATDNVAVAGVQFKLDGVNFGAEDTSAPYSVTWDSTTAVNGIHSLVAVAHDTSGNTSTSSAVTVTVNNTGANPLPDVVVTGFAYSNGVFTSTIKNQGTVATPVGVYIGVGYSVDGIYKTYGTIKGPLAAGASVTIGTNGNSFVIPSGMHTITANVDDVNRFAESDETNNKLTQSITQP